MKKLIIAIALGLMSCQPVPPAIQITLIDSVKHTKKTIMSNSLPIGTVFFVHWGYPDGLRKYRVIDTNKNGYFVKWVNAGTYDDKNIEFMPKDIITQKQFKITN